MKTLRVDRNMLSKLRMKQIPHYSQRVLFTKEILDLWIENQVQQSTQTKDGLRMARR